MQQIRNFIERPPLNLDKGKEKVNEGLTLTCNHIVVEEQD